VPSAGAASGPVNVILLAMAPPGPCAMNRVDAPRSRGEDGPMPFDAERLLRLWTDPLPEDDAASLAFRELYADPVTANGTPLTAAELVGRARAMQGALERPESEVLAVADAGASVAIAFRLAGRQVGPLDTPAGRLPPSGQRIELRIIDVLTLEDGLITEIVMVADWLPAFAAAGALHLPADTDEADRPR
jgi:hypothetical protein